MQTRAWTALKFGLAVTGLDPTAGPRALKRLADAAAARSAGPEIHGLAGDVAKEAVVKGAGAAAAGRVSGVYANTFSSALGF